MPHHQVETCDRISILETRLRRTQIALAACIIIGAAGAMLGVADEKPVPAAAPVTDEIRTRRLIVLDDQDVPRIVMGQDPKDAQRRTRSVAMWLMDKHGHERGGWGTGDDDSIVLAMDAPVGVGDKMRDRLGMGVNAHGGSHFMLIDNQTRGVIGLVSDGSGGGGLQLLKWNTPDKKVSIKTVNFDGDTTQEIPLGEPK